VLRKKNRYAKDHIHETRASADNQAPKNTEDNTSSTTAIFAKPAKMWAWTNVTLVKERLSLIIIVGFTKFDRLGWFEITSSKECALEQSHRQRNSQ
jgi:hypothetical protein